MRDSFHDRHDRIAYAKACAVARRLREDPSLVAEGRAWLERFVAPDPHQAKALLAWRRVLDLPAEAIADLLEEDSAEAQWLRETRPVFCTFSPVEMVALIKAASIRPPPPPPSPSP